MRRLTALCILVVCVRAHELTGATLTGRVLDPSRAVVPGVMVRATNLLTQETLSTQSDPMGNYVFRFLQAGVYTLSAEAQGFERFERERIELRAGDSLTLVINLRIQAMAEQVLDEQLDYNGAESGTILIMDPRNGEILAMATTPRLDIPTDTGIIWMTLKKAYRSTGQSANKYW